MVSTLLVSRYLYDFVTEDLMKKMVFLGGPRQVGKTTFAQNLLSASPGATEAYLNWDDLEQRRRILEKRWPASAKLVVFDELHKFARWRGLIKGYFDTLKRKHAFLVTGSARLDFYRRGGDSLQGRYHYYRMHPFSLPECVSRAGMRPEEALAALLRFGGFPEPFLARNEREHRRWHLERLSRVIHEDLLDLERVKEVSLLERLADALPDRVGAPLSVKNLAQDLEVDFKTMQRWLTILENLYYAYRVPPYGAPRIRAVKKEQKLYLWDWSTIEAPGPRFENLVAGHLLKYCHFMEDTQGHRMELRFLRDIDQREVDFVVLRDRKPLFAVECKTGEKRLSPHIPYFMARTPIPYFYQVHLGEIHRHTAERAEILPFSLFCAKEKLV